MLIILIKISNIVQATFKGTALQDFCVLYKQSTAQDHFVIKEKKTMFRTLYYQKYAWLPL
jgi:hypothetical protein